MAAARRLSGWPGFNPPDPNRVDTMTNWYRPATVRFLREAILACGWSSDEVEGVLIGMSADRLVFARIESRVRTRFGLA